MTSTSRPWRLNAMPRLDGKTAVVTGATGGLGFETACGLAERGAETILAGRHAEKGHAALARLQQRVPHAQARFAGLDLASLASVSRFAESFEGEKLDLLVNNAGVMAPAKRLTTQDGYELQFGTNHLGHFALTGRLLPALARGAGEVVTVASLAAWKGKMPFDDLNASHRYRPFSSYRQSKLANLLFALELDRLAKLKDWPIHSRAAHPGWAMSDIITNSANLGAGKSPLQRIMRSAQEHIGGSVFRLFGQSVAEGAEPILYAALSPQALDGGYYGPQGGGERRGPPGPAPIPPSASSPELAKRLWQVSERMTGVHYDPEERS
ncbi:SDR family oxidoreductase [Kozakia baliensis]|uniref:SDR family oxidoreductase n=1 Tax=Kozakia baliensis TaxID=153496 RepID=UPI00087BE6FF|nr:SDR family oxidoreductase [Kozakia baliensis]AOX20793.1 oxidoreductase [Kozakia baliensis]